MGLIGRPVQESSSICQTPALRGTGAVLERRQAGEKRGRVHEEENMPTHVADSASGRVPAGDGCLVAGAGRGDSRPRGSAGYPGRHRCRAGRRHRDRGRRDLQGAGEQEPQFPGQGHHRTLGSWTVEVHHRLRGRRKRVHLRQRRRPGQRPRRVHHQERPGAVRRGDAYRRGFPHYTKLYFPQQHGYTCRRGRRLRGRHLLQGRHPGQLPDPLAQLRPVPPRDLQLHLLRQHRQLRWGDLRLLGRGAVLCRAGGGPLHLCRKPRDPRRGRHVQLDGRPDGEEQHLLEEHGRYPLPGDPQHRKLPLDHVQQRPGGTPGRREHRPESYVRGRGGLSSAAGVPVHQPGHGRGGLPGHRPERTAASGRVRHGGGRVQRPLLGRGRGRLHEPRVRRAGL